MLVIVGESASGKSTLQNMFINANPQYKKVITYTTRPMRKNEKNGVDYHFVSVQEFENMIANNAFVEYTEYRGWYYGTAKADCDGENLVAVLTPSGLRALKRHGINTISVYLRVDRRSRLIKILQRGDEVDEAYRRNLSDYGQFNGVENEVDYVINNYDYTHDPQQVLEMLNLAITAEGKKNGI